MGRIQGRVFITRNGKINENALKGKAYMIKKGEIQILKSSNCILAILALMMLLT
jgi:hypothetical protein